MAEEITNNTTNEEVVVTHKFELSNLLDSTYPLLQEFKSKAPGSFKHSQALVSMVESVSQGLELDVTFMKICAMYHDIGKSVNPIFFGENQLDNENPHDGFDPWMSAQLLTRHVSDGVNILLNDGNFPREIIEVISQHHGNDVLKFFYDKKVKAQEEGADQIIVDSFRYPCTKPQTVEAAVLSICDQVEAMSKSHVQAGKFDPNKVIATSINGLLDRGQLDDVSMKLGHLKKIKVALAKELEGIYQKRVDYDPDE